MNPSAVALSLPLVVPSEVEAFAATKGVAPFLAGAVALAQSQFSGQTIQVAVEDDPELSYNRTIVFRVAVCGWTAEQYHQARREWVDGLFARCPAPLVHLFGLNLTMCE